MTPIPAIGASVVMLFTTTTTPQLTMTTIEIQNSLASCEQQIDFMKQVNEQSQAMGFAQNISNQCAVMKREK